MERNPQNEIKPTNRFYFFDSSNQLNIYPDGEKKTELQVLSDDLMEKDGFIFKENNVFYFRCGTDESIYFAIDAQNKELGKAELYENFLQHINVDPDYQRQGIGTNLIRAIIKGHTETLLIPYTAESNDLALYLTIEGAALINFCKRKGLIEESQCIEEPLYSLSQDDLMYPK